MPGSYAAVPSHDPNSTSRLHLRRTKSGESAHSAHGRYDGDSLGTAQTYAPSPAPSPAPNVIPNPNPNPDEQSSLFSKSTSSSTSSDEENAWDAESTRGNGDAHSDAGVAHHVDIRGWALARSSEFWLLFTMLGALTGVGLMTIKWVSHF